MDQVAPDLYRLTSGGFAAPHLIMGDVPTLIDAGAPGRGPAIERELQAAGIRVGRIVLTHGDPDHVGGSDHLRAVTGAEVCAGVAERPFIDRSGWPTLPLRRRLLLRGFFRGTPGPTIDRWLDGSEILEGLEVVPMPGHTPGHLAFDWKGWILAGDAFVSGGRFRESLGLFMLDRPTARRSIERLLARAPRGASSSHGLPADHATERLQALVDTWR
ncbi:MAG: MBL fold metallo-hydrolase [Chloroflexi bacterium]|nr:MBL fold metallo-hydrolase [Chloroflexota bacterium]